MSLTKTYHLYTSRSMSHAPSLLFLSQQSTIPFSTLSTCTPVRPNPRPSSRPPLTSSSHADHTCADPSHSSFGPLPETTSPTGYCEPNNLIEDNSTVIKPMYFHKSSMTSTFDTSESSATRLLNPIWTMMIKFGICWLHRCTYRREKQVLTDH